MQHRSTTLSPFDQETDADLLLYMSMAAQDAPAARRAWEAFYLRHVRYLYAVCLRAYGTLFGGGEGISDLVADTFQRAYERADTFTSADITDPDRLRRRVRAWLGRIAQRLAQDHLRGRGKLRASLLDAEQWKHVAQPPPPPAPPDPSSDIALVRRAIEALSEREQLVIRLTFQWYRPDAPHQRLANDVCADLAAQLQTTSENLRQIRRRALAKIEAYVRRSRVTDAHPVRSPSP